jgi:hypothetical protein
VIRLAVLLAVALGACKKTPPGEAGNLEEGALRQLRQAQAMEARNLLGSIASSARMYAMEEHVARGGAPAPRGFPVGDTGYQPAPGTCCQQPGGKCLVKGGEWNADPWPTLGFGIADAYAYSYRYVSDGQTFTALALGDLDCDGTFSTFAISGQMQGESPGVQPLTVQDEIE